MVPDGTGVWSHGILVVCFAKKVSREIKGMGVDKNI